MKPAAGMGRGGMRARRGRSAVVRYTLGTAYTVERGYRLKLSSEAYSFSDVGPSGHRVARTLRCGGLVPRP